MAFIDGTVVNVALPALQTVLHVSVTDIQWVVESYALLLASLLLLRIQRSGSLILRYACAAFECNNGFVDAGEREVLLDSLEPGQ
jgi:hypothetical protein